MPPVAIATLTPAAVRQDLQNDGLDSLGLTTLALSPRWADTTPLPSAYNAGALTLTLAAPHAPFRAIREFAFTPASSTLASGLSDASTTLAVSAGQGVRFPSPTGGHVLLTLSNASGSKYEVVVCTARAGDNLTIGRGAMGTARQAFSAGDNVRLRLSAGARTTDFTGADGKPLGGDCAVLRLHPQAALRLETLTAVRYAGAGAPRILPVPWAMVVQGAQGFATPGWFEPDEVLKNISGAVSFHDGRGLILDPIYVAALLADLQAFLPGLIGQNLSVPLAGLGGVQEISNLTSGTLLHCIDLHGGVYTPPFAGATLVTRDSGGVVTNTVPLTPLVKLNSGDGIDSGGSDGGRLRWGFATNGVLGTTRLVPPPLAAPLSRPFYQVAVVDTAWALLGNRTGAVVLGVGPDDQTLPNDVLPPVRDNLLVTYCVDGPDVLGRSAAVLSRSGLSMLLAISPVLDPTMSTPTQAGVNAHWPAFPGPNSAVGFPSPPASPANGLTAAFTSTNDVVVTIAADRVPNGAHVRIYPSTFVVIPAIGEEPSMVRGDGGAAVAQASVPTQVLMPNPFGLAAGQPRPSPANLTMDIVVAPRAGRRKLTGGVSVSVAAGPAAPPADPFGGGNAVGLLPAMFEAVGPVPLFGIPTTVTPPGTAPSSVIGFVRALASETSPRQGPRLPTMARFDTAIVTGVPSATSPALLWEAVLGGGRWAPETRSAQHSSGNPGNPAGPDVHAAGVHVTGALAYDVARHAMRRAQPILPLPVNLGSPGWLVAMDGNNFNPPVDSNTSQTGVGVVLETVAAICESPELSLMTPPAPGFTVQTVINNIASALGVPAPGITLANEPRIQSEIRREIIVSRNGLRDGLWSLRRAVHEARELIYIESPQFAATGAVDLVAEVVSSLAAHPNLRVIVCTPRESDFAPTYRGWSRQHFRARSQAVSDLLTVAPERVLVFHPVGFPGRTAFVRSTTVVVDDVWCLVGATHWRRRGMTFDGSTAIASFDRQMEDGYSKGVRSFRRLLMAAKLDIQPPVTGSPTADWLRLGRPGSAFQLVSDYLKGGGLGKIQPLWAGPSDTSVLPATDDIADPDGSSGAAFLTTLASLIAEAGD